jgi:hypothetical protein
MRPPLVVFNAPACNFAPRVPEIPKPARVQAFITQSAVEAFHVTVLRWLSGLNVNRANAALRAPGQIVPTADLRPIVRAKKLWCATELNDSLQHSRYTPAWHAGIGFQSQAFAGKGIDDA